MRLAAGSDTLVVGMTKRELLDDLGRVRDLMSTPSSRSAIAHFLDRLIEGVKRASSDVYDVAELREKLVLRDNEIASLRRRLDEAERHAEGYQKRGSP